MLEQLLLKSAEEEGHLETAKDKLKILIKELLKKLGPHEAIGLWFDDAGWIVADREDGRVHYIETGCEGSFGGVENLDTYFSQRIRTISDVRALCGRLSKPVVYGTDGGTLKFKDYRELVAFSEPANCN